MKKNEEEQNQIDREVDVEVQVSSGEEDDIIFWSSKAYKLIIKEIKIESNGGFYYDTKTSQKINNQVIISSNEEAYTIEIPFCFVYPDRITIES